jgi:hypothetical protein
MNCNEFETLVNDLARKRMMDAALRNETDSHAKDCARCHARLIEEKQLTVGLRALAILDENKKAPASMEASLLAAFRKNSSSTHTPIAAMPSLSSTASHKSRINLWWVAAAVFLILFAIAALRLQQPHKIEKAPEQMVQQQPKPQELSPDNKEDKKIVPDNSPAPDKNDELHVNADNRQRKAPRQNVSRKDLQKLSPQVANNESTGSTSTPEALPGPEQLTQNEVTTPFISLTQGYTLPMPEGGQLLRIEMPRSALASFGLPVNEERMNGRIKADVVVGNDGIPRAIRFVR